MVVGLGAGTASRLSGWPERIRWPTRPRAGAGAAGLTGGPIQVVRRALAQIEAIEEGLRTVDGRLDILLRPFDAIVERLSSVPGASRPVAQALIAEIGADVERFPRP
jgi:hypothetical protein